MEQSQRDEFKTLFCEQFNCPPAKYAENAFRRCLYPHARVLAPIIHLLAPSYFTLDYELLQGLSAAVDLTDVRACVDNFSQANSWSGSFFRTVLRLRVSGRRTTRLADQLFQEAERSQPFAEEAAASGGGGSANHRR